MRNPKLDKRDDRNDTAVDIMQYRPEYLPWLKDNQPKIRGFFDPSSPLDEELSDDEVSSIVTVPTKPTPEERHRYANRKEDHNINMEDSTESESLNSEEELQIEKEVIKRLKQSDFTTAEQQAKEKNRLTSLLCNTALMDKKLKAKQVKRAKIKKKQKEIEKKRNG